MKTWFSKIDCGTFSILLLLRPLHKMRAMVAALTGVENPVEKEDSIRDCQ
jgi:hypothetical protein